MATNGSPASWEAIKLGVKTAAERGAEVHFVHVVPTVDLALPIDVEDVGYAILYEPGVHERVVLEDAAAVATEHGVVASTALLGGSAARAIAAYGEACDTDLIVVGCQGHRAVTGALLGSVSLALLRDSKGAS